MLIHLKSRVLSLGAVAFLCFSVSQLTAPLGGMAFASHHPAAKHETKASAEESRQAIAHGEKNNCVGSACMAMGHKEMARTFDQLRAKVNNGRGVTDSQFHEVVTKYGFRLQDIGQFSGKGSNDVTKFRKAVSEAKGSGKNYFISYGDHMEAIAKGVLPDGYLTHYQRTGSAKIWEVSPEK